MTKGPAVPYAMPVMTLFADTLALPDACQVTWWCLSIASSIYKTSDKLKQAEAFCLFTCRTVKKSPRARYGKPVMMPSSESVDESDAGNGSEGEGAFPASYQPPLAGLMSKGKLSFVGLLHSLECMPLAMYLNVHST